MFPLRRSISQSVLRINDVYPLSNVNKEKKIKNVPPPDTSQFKITYQVKKSGSREEDQIIRQETGRN